MYDQNVPMVAVKGEIRELAVTRSLTAKLAAELIELALDQGMRPTSTAAEGPMLEVRLAEPLLARLSARAKDHGLSVFEASISLALAGLPIRKAALAEQEADRLAAEKAEVDRKEQLERRAQELLPSLKAPSIKIREVNGRLRLYFPYCEEAIGIIKDLPGAAFQWNDGGSDYDPHWHVSVKYKKRVLRAIELIEPLLRLEAARAAATFESEVPTTSRRIRLKLKWPWLAVSTPYNEHIVSEFRKLKLAGKAHYRGDWEVRWDHRDVLYRLLPRLAELLE